MPLYTTKEKVTGDDRITRLRNAVQYFKPGICTERALIWTEYHKKKENRKKSAHIQMAEALRDVLMRKSITIYPDELIVGNFTSKRVGGFIFPELHGIPVLMDIFKFSKRQTNPLQISPDEIRSLLKIVPFWIFRFLSLKAFKNPFKKIGYAINQLKGHFFLINESGGISHIAPDYEKLITLGTSGIIKDVDKILNDLPENSESRSFYEAVKIIAEALSKFGERYAALAENMASSEEDPNRKKELLRISEICSHVPRNPARTMQEALQSLFFAQIAINLESLDNAVCPGRMDQYLYPFYKKDIKKGILNREKAKELISAFSVKMSEIIPVFSKHLTNFHGGMFNGQVVTIGGVNENGRDAVNELSYIFLEVMDELRMRQPNYHARVHSKSGEKYINKINSILAGGSNSPALYNDDVIIKTMQNFGYSLEDARNYTAIGCVEPASQGKSFSSTDAALFNVPIILEMALNQGRRFGSIKRYGAKTRPVSKMASIEDVKTAFEQQLKFQVGKLIEYIKAIETANMKFHPTPLTSMLLEGCLASGKCSTAGGAVYNFSGIQCVAPVDTGDSLYAIEKAVFMDKTLTLKELVHLLKKNFPDTRKLAYLRGLKKFGNDDNEVDKWSVYVVDTFVKTLSDFGKNTRGGSYVTGLYSVTSHEYFGKITGALPHGRRKGESFSSGVSPVNGMDRKGPTSLVNSVSRFNFAKISNGINFNIKFDPHTLRGKSGYKAFGSILKTYFKKGGMQIQVNVLDPEILKKAKDNPGLYPNLLVRVSGYSAYFNDLTPELKDEIIRRSSISVCS